MTDQENIIWLAGLLEGEGSFGIHKKNIYIHLCMTDRDVILKAATIMLCTFGILTRRNGRKTAWQCSLWGTKAAIVMRKILPYMGERRSQKIKESLEVYDSKRKVA